MNSPADVTLKSHQPSMLRSARSYLNAGELPGIAYILVAVSLLLLVFTNGFATLGNAKTIGIQSAILLLLALPMTLIIMTEGLDISMGAVMGLCGVVLAQALVGGNNLAVALLLSCAVGAAFGFTNAMLVVLLKMPAFVATLGTLGIAQGVALVLTDGQSVVGIGDTLGKLYGGSLLSIPIPICIAVAAYAVTYFVLYKTRFGNYIFALGGNREALVLAGVRANVYHMAVYIAGGFMAGVAALLLTARMNSGHPTAALGMEFDAIAAVIVGGTTFDNGNGKLVGTLLGVLAIGVVRNGLNLLGVPSSLQVASVGLLVIIALLIDVIRGKS